MTSLGSLRVALALAVALVLTSCRGREADEAGAPARDSSTADSSGASVTLDDRARAFGGIEVGSARTAPVERTVSTTGTLAWDPAQVTDVGAPVRGRVLQLRGTVGDRVAEGSVVAVIESPDNLSGRFEVRAPRGGVITERAASVGTVLDQGGRLLRVVNDSHLWLLVTIPPGRSDRPSVGSLVHAEIPAAGASVDSRIDAILPEADSISHAALGRAVIANGDRRLAAGMTALVRATVGARTPTVIVPRSSVVYVRGRPVVYVADGKSFRAVAVETGAPVGQSEIAIVRGLDGRERIVTVGAQQLANAHFDFKGLGDDEDDEESP